MAFNYHITNIFEYQNQYILNKFREVLKLLNYS